MEAGFGIGTFIQDQHATRMQHGAGGQFGLNLADDALRGPGRIRHKLLQGLAVVGRRNDAKRDIGKGALAGHGQDAAQIDPGVGTAITGGGGEAGAKAGPQGMEALSQARDGLGRQSPAVGVEEIAGWFKCVHGSLSFTTRDV